MSSSGVQRLWNQFISEDTESRRPVPGPLRATTSAGNRFLPLSAEEGEALPYLVSIHSITSGKGISATAVRRRFRNFVLYAWTISARLCRVRKHDSWNQTATGFWTVHRWAHVHTRERFGQILIYREQRTRYNQLNTAERLSYRSGGIIVWAGFSLCGHTDLHFFPWGNSCDISDEILDIYVLAVVIRNVSFSWLIMRNLTNLFNFINIFFSNYKEKFCDQIKKKTSSVNQIIWLFYLNT